METEIECEDACELAQIEQDKECADRITLFGMYTMLPEALRKRCNGQFLGALVILVAALICALYFNRVMYAFIGLCFAGFVAWLGIRVLYRSRSGKIVYKQMECIKAYAVPLVKNQAILILREADVPVGDERGVHKYRIANKKEISLLTKGTLLTIYVDLDTPGELLAWQIIG